jgi:hypothetical protein
MRGKRKARWTFGPFTDAAIFWALVYFMAVILGWSGLEKLFRLGAICFRSYWMQGAALRGAEVVRIPLPTQ